MSAKRILVVDDEKQIVEVLGDYLAANGYAVSKAYGGRQALAVFAQTQPALVILDLMMPDLSGEEVCKRIRQQSQTPIIMLTAKADEEAMLNGLHIGADDYIIKPASPRQVVARVGAVLRRGAAQPTQAAPYDDGYLFIDYKNYAVKANRKPIDLTPTEFKMLACLSKNPGTVFTRDQLIADALGGDFDGYDRTLDTYIKNLRKKIEPEPKKPQFICTVYGVGYRFAGGRDLCAYEPNSLWHSS